MKLAMVLLAALATAASPTYAAGDANKGEADFKQCQTCHTVIDPDGNVLAGKGAKIGPNLYGVFGRTAGTYPGFKYGDSMAAAGAAGLVWDEANFVAYVQNPAAFLKDKLGDNSAKAKMAFKLKDAATAEDAYAYLVQFSPAAAAAAPADPAAAPADPAATPAPAP